jgi:hypothetical protein
MLRLLGTLLLLLIVWPCYAQVPTDLADAYVETTGLAAQAEQVGGQVAQQVMGQAAQFPEPAQAPFREIYAQELGAEALERRLQSYVAAEGEADSLRAVVAWFEQPLVARMQALEEAASESGEAQVALQMYAMTGSFGDYTVPEAREAQMDRYLAATKATDNAIELYLDIIVASAESTAGLGTAEDRPPADSIRAQMRPQLEGMITGMVRGGSLYTFREVSDADFDAYVAQLEAPVAQYGMTLNADALRAALTGAVADAGAAFVETLQALDAAGEIDLDAFRAEMERKAAQQRQMQQHQGMEDDG